MEMIDLDNINLDEFFEGIEVRDDSPKQRVTIIDAKVTPNKMNNGFNLKLKVKFKNGFELSDWIVIQHENEKAVQIGKQKYKEILTYTGCSKVSELLGKEILVYIENDGKYDRISRYFDSLESWEKYKPRTVKAKIDFAIPELGI